ncbi:MAG: STAS domain-containing protein [Polyangia bacterium]
MKERTRRALAAFLEGQHTALIERATDWVIETATDLRGQRPRDETRRLVIGVLESNSALLLAGDRGRLQEFIEHVTTLRAQAQFHLSTLLRGFASVRVAAGEIMPKVGVPPELQVEILHALDEAYLGCISDVSDQFMIKLHDNLLQERERLRHDLDLARRERIEELEGNLSTIRAQQEELSALTSPILRIWDGALVLPLIGAFDGDRAMQVSQRLLHTVVETRSRIVLIDITGLSVIDTHATSCLIRLVYALRLLGADGYIVGMTSAVASTLVSLQVELGAMQTFSNLEAGLRAVLSRLGLRVQRKNPT